MSTISLTVERGQHAGPRFVRTRAAFAMARRAAVAVVAPHRAVPRRLLEMPLTLAAVGFVDTAAWQAPHWVGWLVTGFSLLVVEHLVADDEPPRPA